MIVAAESRPTTARSFRFVVSIFPEVRKGRVARVARLVTLAASAIALHAGCWRSATTGTDAGIDIVTGAGGGSMGAGGLMMTDAAADSATGPVLPTASCDAIGTAPTLPATTCATVMATKTVTNGIPTDESTLDTVAIQSALDTCPAGQAVRLVTDGGANVAFLTGGLFLRSGVTLWLDDGVTVFGSRNPRDFDGVPNSGKCALMGSNADCNALINVVGSQNAALMGTGTLDGRGGELIIGGTTNWWDLEDADQGNLVAPRMVWVRPGNGFVLSGVTLKNAPKFHVVIERTVGFTVWGITINTSANSVNTDGVDPSASTNGIIAYNKISTGDDNIAIKASGPPTVSNIVIAHNHFGHGHGMSIGSETNAGVQNVAVCDLTIDGAQNGLRIKSDASRGGVVQQISYTDVCMRNVSDPLVFDSYYSSATGTLIPWFKDISIRNVHSLSGGKLVFRGWDAAHTEALWLDNVVLDTAPTSINASNVALNMGPNPVTNIVPTGTTNVTVNKAISGAAAPRDCTNVWVTF
jgi:polygalacturonase